MNAAIQPVIPAAERAKSYYSATLNEETNYPTLQGQVSVDVDPPYARIEIADDGTGIGPHRPEGRLGLAIMAERAQRIRGQLHISPRKEGGGTSVAVVLGSSPNRTGRAADSGPST